MFALSYFVTVLCAAGVVLGAKTPTVPVEDAPSIISALFTDGNGRDSRADFTPGNWEFDGCKISCPVYDATYETCQTEGLISTDQCDTNNTVAEWPIHLIKQDGAPARCTYKGSESGTFKIQGPGVSNVTDLPTS